MSHSLALSRNLMRLSLRDNPMLRSIPSGAFDALADLVSLDLGHCGIEAVSETAGLGGLRSLEVLKLEGNRLVHLDSQRTLPISLRYVKYV